jgi:arsenate reductase-like glutaredoxin family protein|tara:strand:+ start:764 stop:907 length:144 start_codon:yes stop_codon:yes gene_type:complete
MGGSTKCTMCKSYVKFVDGKHIVVDVEDTKKTATLDSLTTKINQRLK